ncbi:hypothetical protein AAHE18_14G206900 [Arachis hypogaea]|nr:uncharacterized protein DS421_14g477780 [Arachis hypogaea]
MLQRLIGLNCVKFLSERILGMIDIKVWFALAIFSGFLMIICTQFTTKSVIMSQECWKNFAGSPSLPGTFQLPILNTTCLTSSWVICLLKWFKSASASPGNLPVTGKSGKNKS